MSVTKVDDKQVDLSSVDQDVKLLGGLRLERTQPDIVMRDTGNALPAGLWKISQGGDSISLEKNTAVAGDFSDTKTVAAFALDEILLGASNAPITLTVTGDVVFRDGEIVQIESATPTLVLQDTGESLPDGLFRVVLDGDTLYFHQNTAVAGDFSTSVRYLEMYQDIGIPQLSVPGGTVLLVQDKERLQSVTPIIELRDTAEALPDGLVRIKGDDARLWIDVNTAIDGDFSTYVSPLIVSSNNVDITGQLDLFNPAAGLGGVSFHDSDDGMGHGEGDLYVNNDERLHYVDDTLDNTIAYLTDITTETFVTREVPSGTINGSNVTFTLANTPTAGSEEIYLNGFLQNLGAGNDYTISGATITFVVAPVTSSVLLVSYRY